MGDAAAAERQEPHRTHSPLARKLIDHDNKKDSGWALPQLICAKSASIFTLIFVLAFSESFGEMMGEGGVDID